MHKSLLELELLARMSAEERARHEQSRDLEYQALLRLALGESCPPCPPPLPAGATLENYSTPLPFAEQARWSYFILNNVDILYGTERHFLN